MLGCLPKSNYDLFSFPFNERQMARPGPVEGLENNKNYNLVDH